MKQISKITKYMWKILNSMSVDKFFNDFFEFFPKNLPILCLFKDFLKINKV